MKQKFPLIHAQERAAYLRELLAPHCLRIEIAGSIRRKRPEVGDIEILYIPKRLEGVPKGDLMPKILDHSHKRILHLVKEGILDFRVKKNGATSFGPRVKLLVDTKSGIPVDIFSCDEQQWVNNLVSRTGGKMTNITIASYAKRLGWNWLMSDIGFVNKRTSEVFAPQCEEDVFRFARVPYMEPEDRP